MVNTKRRRGIGVKIWLIEALKEIADQEPAKGGRVTPTSVANQIWKGKRDPIVLKRACRLKKESKEPHAKKGISTQEWLWLAIKEYGEMRNESASKVAALMLVGKIPPVPAECIKVGKQKAMQREQERALHGGKEPPSRRSGVSKERQEARRLAREAKEAAREQKRFEREKAKEDRRLARQAAKEEKKKEREAAKREKERQRKAKQKEKEEKKRSQRDVTVTNEKEKEKVDERGYPLSKGQPFCRDEDKDRKVNPNDDFFGGIFNM